MRKSPTRRSRRLLPLCAILSMLLLLALMAACAVEEENGSSGDREDSRERATSDQSGDRSSGGGSIFSRRSTDSPEPTVGTRGQGSGISSIFPGSTGAGPGEDPEPTSALPLAAAGDLHCPRRQPDPDVMSPPAGASPETDKEALLALFEATGGETWDKSGTWGGLSPVAEWQGVGVGGSTPAGQAARRVLPTPTPLTDAEVEQLADKLLSGELPWPAEWENNYGIVKGGIERGPLVAALLTKQLTLPPTPGGDGADRDRVTGLVLSGLTGELPPELGNLTALQTLYITDSQLGGELPPELGNLTALQTLSITGSQLAGELPPELGNLTSLDTLTITGSELAGELPPELGNLTSLEELSLGSNQLCGEIPPELDGLAELQELNLAGNRLIGEIPDALSRLVNLETLHLADNQLTGEIPFWLSGFSDLAILNLSGNQLAGELPIQLDDLALGLNTLRVGGNQLEGCKSDFLRDFVEDSNDSLPVCDPENHTGDTEALIAFHKALGMKPNWGSWLSREPVGEWEGVSVGFDGRVTALNPRGAGMEGELPPELGSLTSLRVLEIGGKFAGELPPELGKLTKLKSISIAGTYSRFALGGCSSDVNSYKGTILERACRYASEFTAVSVGGSHTCGVMVNGFVHCWGRSQGGQVVPPEGEFTAVSAGSNFTCGVRNDGSVECWGYNDSGQATPPDGEFVSVSAGEQHTCGLRSNGSIECWGQLSYSIRGLGYNRKFDIPQQPAGKFASVSAGNGYTCGMKADGSVECWGKTAFKAHGNAYDIPPPEGRFASFSTGTSYYCGVRTDGTVACWGVNDGGKATPPEGEFASVSAGHRHSCGVRTDGSVACWGPDAWGQVTATPHEGGFTSVSAGKIHARHTCGVRTDGTVECWGEMTYTDANPRLIQELRAGDDYVCVLSPKSPEGCIGEPPVR